jgi:hypothetical protein
MLSFLLIIIYFLMNSILSLSNNQVYIDVDYGENDTIILYYNLTTNYSYLITFRAFGDEQLNLGLFPLTNKSKENSIEISHQYQTKEIFYLFIICFHFIRPYNDLDIQCKDIHLLKKDQNKTKLTKDFLPSYNPLFVPMMYALSIIMLLPVIIQHHRRKTAQLVQRRKQIRRLSMTIAEDDQNPQQHLGKKLLSHIVDNGNIIYENIPMEIELIAMGPTRKTLDDTNENVNVQFTLENLPSFRHNYDDNARSEHEDVNADDCIAHLLNSTPWNTPHIEQSFTANFSQYPVVHDSATAIKEQHAPTIIPFDDDDDDRKPILTSTKHPKMNLYRTNRVFFESDV